MREPGRVERDEACEPLCGPGVSPSPFLHMAGRPAQSLHNSTPGQWQRVLPHGGVGHGLGSLDLVQFSSVQSLSRVRLFATP